MMFHKLAVKEVYDRTQVTSSVYHKNGDCPSLANSETVTITDQQRDGFDPCPVCYTKEERERYHND